MDFLGERPLYLISKFANRVYSDVDYTADDDQFFIFGKETTGLPESFMREHAEKCLRIPMNDEHVRPFQQLLAAITAVFRSWNNPRAKTYRSLHRIPEISSIASSFDTGSPDQCVGWDR